MANNIDLSMTLDMTESSVYHLIDELYKNASSENLDEVKTISKLLLDLFDRLDTLVQFDW